MKEPNNEELLSHLFMSYVRLDDYKKQQDVGMALYKLIPKNPYFFWSVMSLYLQVSSFFLISFPPSLSFFFFLSSISPPQFLYIYLYTYT